MDDVSKNMTDLFDLAKKAEIDYPIKNITKVIGASATIGVVGGMSSFFKFSTFVIMLGSMITAVTVFVMLNPMATSAEVTHELPTFETQELVTTKKVVSAMPEKELIEENELKSILPIDEDTADPIFEEIVIEDTMLPEELEVMEETVWKGVSEDKESFHSVHLNISANVKIIKGKKSKISFEGNEYLEDLVELKIENNVLEISVKKGKQRELNKHVSKHSVSITLTMTQIESLVINGSGDITSNDDIAAEHLNIQINGSGDIILDKVAPGRFEISVNGSGDVGIYGVGESLGGEININGSGDVCTKTLNATFVSVNIIGSGDVTVACSKKLDVSIIGSGDVCYTGNPEMTFQKLGSGDLERCD